VKAQLKGKKTKRKKKKQKKPFKSRKLNTKMQPHAFSASASQH
jgi:hypothetical protein